MNSVMNKIQLTEKRCRDKLKKEIKIKIKSLKNEMIKLEKLKKTLTGTMINYKKTKKTTNLQTREQYELNKSEALIRKKKRMK